MSVVVDTWLDINGQRLDSFFISYHFLPLSLIDVTYQVAIFRLQGAFSFNIDMDINGFCQENLMSNFLVQVKVGKTYKFDTLQLY